jgi:hypothetical protein
MMSELDCLKACPKCSRHVRCHERSCPFCGVSLQYFMRVPDYRVKTRLGRGATAALGAALGAAGFAFGCSDNAPQPLYGAACSPPSCTFPTGGDTSAGGTSSTGGAEVGGGTGGGAEVGGGTGGGAEVGGAAGAGTSGEGGAAGGDPL